MTVCVFAASSGRIAGRYFDEAEKLGELLALSRLDVVFGGGGIGLMGKLADSVLAGNGRITGVIPDFMQAEGWGHQGLTKMIVTADMNDRKRTMFSLSDAVIALPGGIGTLEEVTEAITLKQLGLFRGPVILLNTLGYYNHLIEFLDHMIISNFLRLEHKGIWEIVESPSDAVEAVLNYNGWMDNPRSIAKIY